MSFPRYPEYKDSGVEWLGAIPAHWKCVRIATLFREVNEPGNDDLPILSVSIHDGVSDKELDADETERKVSRSDDRSKYKSVAPGDLTYNMMRAWQGGFGTVAVHGMVSPAYVVARPTREFSTSNVEMLLRTPMAVSEMRRHSRGITDFRLRLYWEDFKCLEVALPPRSEQLTIATFLDHETAKIDALVAEQKKLIGLLKEKRQAVISHAITKGLNTDAPMKDSRIEWLGEVPAHWEVGPLKRFAEVIDCKHHTVQFLDDGWPIVSIRELRNDHIDLADAKLTSRDEWDFLREGRIPRHGDMIFCRNASVGAVGYVDFDEPFCMGQDVCLIRPDSTSRFMHFQLTSTLIRSQIEAFLIGATIRRANVEEIRGLLVAHPPADEQETIADFLAARTADFDALSADTESAVALLKERRSALISAAVTGKIDVRALVASAPVSPEVTCV